MSEHEKAFRLTGRGTRSCSTRRDAIGGGAALIKTGGFLVWNRFRKTFSAAGRCEIPRFEVESGEAGSGYPIGGMPCVGGPSCERATEAGWERMREAGRVSGYQSRFPNRSSRATPQSDSFAIVKLRRQAVDAARRITDAILRVSRPLPSFVIAGAMRCGTTALYEYLACHPQVTASRRKEVHYFDLNFKRGPGWYARQFPVARRLPDGTASRSFEASPYYMFDPRVPARLRAALPDARILFLLRDPVERAISHYRKNIRDKREPLSFAEAIDAEKERLMGEEERLLADPGARSPVHQYFSYVARGKYAIQLDRYRGHFPAEQLLVVNAERLFEDPTPVVDEICLFLGLDPWHPGRFGPANASGAAVMIGEDVRRRLEAVFEPHEAALEASIGWRPSAWRAAAA